VFSHSVRASKAACQRGAAPPTEFGGICVQMDTPSEGSIVSNAV
jgi:hypothetical protein